MRHFREDYRFIVDLRSISTEELQALLDEIEWRPRPWHSTRRACLRGTGQGCRRTQYASTLG